MENKAKTVEDFFGPVISSYTRADALADGMLVDVSELAREAGFVIPVAVTASVWDECIDWPEESEQGFGQSIDGRLWDVLFMAHWKIKECTWLEKEETECSEVCLIRTGYMDLEYQLNVIPKDTKAETITEIDDFTGAKLTTLKINIGPGDNAEPVITIMQTYED